MSKRTKDVFKEGVDTYSINLLWRNEFRVEDQEYIYPTTDLKELKAKLFDTSLLWAEQHKKADIKIWYDSKLVTDKAVKNTAEILNKLLKENELNNITLHDIREIKFVNDNEVLFTQDIGVYLCVDYLKEIIIAHELIDMNYDGTVYADLKYRDAPRYSESNKIFNKAELFDCETMQKLKKCGIVAGQSLVPTTPENQFLQAVNDELLTDTLRIIINADANRIINLLNATLGIQERFFGEMHIIPLASATREITELYMGRKAGTIIVNEGFLENKMPDERWVKYDPKEHGHEPLGNAVNLYNHNFLYTDYNADPIKGFRPHEFIKYGQTEQVCAAVRGEMRQGFCHTDKFVFPSEGHEPFTANFWQGWQGDKDNILIETAGNGGQLSDDIYDIK